MQLCAAFVPVLPAQGLLGGIRTSLLPTLDGSAQPPASNLLPAPPCSPVASVPTGPSTVSHALGHLKGAAHRLAGNITASRPCGFRPSSP